MEPTLSLENGKQHLLRDGTVEHNLLSLTTFLGFNVAQEDILLGILVIAFYWSFRKTT